jgi:poly(hydroxyalkanoate) depolymerase family esterase
MAVSNPSAPSEPGAGRTPPPRRGRPPAADPVRPAAPGRWIHRHFHGDHGSREYDVYVPSGLSTDRRAPLVLLLHGCRQRPVDFAEESGFVATADADGLILLAPRQEAHHQLQRCWRWYESEHQRRGRGEPAILAGLVEQVLAESDLWRADRRRVYAAGLSAGGAMSLIMATTYPDVIAAAGVHSATAYRSATQGFSALGAMSAHATMPAHEFIRGEMAPVVLIHGTNDPVVRAPNGDRIVDQWLASRDAAPLTGLNRVRPLATTRALVVDGRRCIRTRWYTARGRRVLEYWRIDGLRHAWSGGRRKGPFVDVKGPRAADVMASFFLRHKLPHAGAGLPAGGAPAAVVAKERPDRPPMIWFEDAD